MWEVDRVAIRANINLLSPSVPWETCKTDGNSGAGRQWRLAGDLNTSLVHSHGDERTGEQRQTAVTDNSKSKKLLYIYNQKMAV